MNGAAQSPGQKSITFAMDAAVTAVAQYTVNTSYTLTVQSTPPTGLVIGSSTGQNGKTNCTKRRNRIRDERESPRRRRRTRPGTPSGNGR